MSDAIAEKVNKKDHIQHTENLLYTSLLPGTIENITAATS